MTQHLTATSTQNIVWGLKPNLNSATRDDTSGPLEKISLYCLQSYTIYNVGRMFPTSAKVAHISSGWVFKGSQAITPAAEVLKDMRSKIP